ncbi:hypothetical protein RU639_009524 [Aspergillus parasiticus]
MEVIFVRQDGILYSGKWANRLDSPRTLNDLQEVKQIPTEDRCPEVNPTCKSLAKLKHAKFFARIPIRILRPIMAIRRLTVESLGYVSRDMRPHYLKRSILDASAKVAFLSSARERVKENMKSRLEGILAAIKHLHSLGLVHNDINSANIMLDEDGTLILIDFDSCRYIRESLSSTETKRTRHWHDPSVDISLEKNDLDALKDLQIWLTGSVDDDFLFE